MAAVEIPNEEDVFAIHHQGLPPGHIGSCPIDRSPLFYAARTFLGRFALCRERHVFKVETVERSSFGRLIRQRGLKSTDIRGW